MRSMVMIGLSIHSCTTVARMAAPVGVVSSALIDEGDSGTPLRRAAVPGAGMGIRPWAHLTIPLPVGTERLVMRRARADRGRWPLLRCRRYCPRAPTSWKWTFSKGHAVSRRLGLGQAAEDAQGQLALRWR